jgi:hypothetical protein
MSHRKHNNVIKYPITIIIIIITIYFPVQTSARSRHLICLQQYVLNTSDEHDITSQMCRTIYFTSDRVRFQLDFPAYESSHIDFNAQIVHFVPIGVFKPVFQGVSTILLGSILTKPVCNVHWLYLINYNV